MTNPTEKTVEMRLILSLLGGVAGFLIWFLADVVGDQIDNDRLIMFLVALIGSFSGAMLICTGPLGLRRAGVVGAIVSIPASVLLFWASFRFEDLGTYISSGLPVFAFATLITVPLPFLISVRLEDKTWNDFETLFDAAWDIVVRYGAAWVFVGVFWGVVFLSDALLRIVGLDIIKQVLRIDAVPPVLTGLALGMAIAVVDELSDFISPFLVLRLLRLLLPLVLVVVTIFIVAVPFKGLSGLFGSLSAAATLLAITAGSVTLITTALAQNDEYAVSSKIMVLSARGVSVLTAILAGLALFAIWMRISQYGLTPDRMLAGMVALIGVGYGLVYGISAIFKEKWMQKIRKANVYLALLVVGVAALWLTPIVNPQRLSTNNQIARFIAGKTSVDDIDLWEIGHEWGVVGKQGIARLQALSDQKEFAGLAAKITKFEAANSRYAYRRDQRGADRQSQTDLIVENLPVRVVGDAIASPALVRQVLEHAEIYEIENLFRNCVERASAEPPRCVMVFIGNADKDLSKPDALMIWNIGHKQAVMSAYGFNGKQYKRQQPLRLGQDEIDRTMPSEVIGEILDGNISVGSITLPTLQIKDQVLFIQP